MNYLRKESILRRKWRKRQKAYTMKYMNIIDAQFVGYLEVEYDKEAYKKEVNRLKKYKSTDYKGVYGVTGYNKEYELLAVYTDEEHGFVYALTDNKNMFSPLLYDTQQISY